MLMDRIWQTSSLDYRDPPVPFEEIVRLIDAAGLSTAAGCTRSDVVEALHEHQPAAVTLVGSVLTGATVARVCGPDAHLMTLAIHPDWRHRGIGSDLLRSLDQEIIHRGARRLLAVVHPGQSGELAFANQGFTRVDGLHLYVRDASMVPEELAVVERYGGVVPAAGLLEAMKGFSAIKHLLESRVVAPLSHRDLAADLGLVPPGAVLLFGPPGTGKTSFARAVASRLSWVFVELHPSLLGQGIEGARRLREQLQELGRVERLVCFIDEADEIASDRSERPDSQPLVNELLKAIPLFKANARRLMVMATNSIDAIDAALLRPGRFDLIVPVGPPDEEGRAELIAELFPVGDRGELARRTQGFTPADFALVAQRSAQLAFDRALEGGEGRVLPDDILRAVDATRPSVGPEAAARFAIEAASHARL